MVDPGETVATTLIREFKEEALDILESGSKSGNDTQEKVDDLFSEKGKEVTYVVSTWNDNKVH